MSKLDDFSGSELVETIARKYGEMLEPDQMEDVLQAGHLGLLIASQKITQGKIQDDLEDWVSLHIEAHVQSCLKKLGLPVDSMDEDKREVELVYGEDVDDRSAHNQEVYCYAMELSGKISQVLKEVDEGVGVMPEDNDNQSIFGAIMGPYFERLRDRTRLNLVKDLSEIR